MSSTVVLGEQPIIRDWLEQRQVLGQDTHDEVWEGVYYVAPQAGVGHAIVQGQVFEKLVERARRAGLVSVPEFNLGSPQDFRVPDAGWLDEWPTLDQVYATAARVVLEVLSPDDKTYDKFPFYASHGVVEILVADPRRRTVECWRRSQDAGTYQPTPGSKELDVDMATLVSEIRWP